MILFLYRYLIGVLKCHQTGKKKDTVVWPSFVAPFQLPLLRRSNYDQKKNRFVITTGKEKSSSRLSGGCAIVFMTGKKSSSRLSGGCAIAITTGKK